MRKEKVTPKGSPALVNPINNGIDEQEQNGVTVPRRAAMIFAPIPLNLPNIPTRLIGLRHYAIDYSSSPEHWKIEYFCLDLIVIHINI